MEALEYIRQQVGLHFDPLVAETFLELPASKRNGTWISDLRPVTKAVNSKTFVI